MDFIKKVFDGEIDEDVHLQFQKFSRGEFRNRAMIKAKKVKENYTLSTTYEFANELVGSIAKKLGDNKTEVKGAVISTLDLGKEIDYQSKKQFMGIKQYILEKEISGNEMIEMIKKYPKVFFALSFDSKKGDVLKIKAKAPKSAKPKNKDEAPNPDFCKLTTNDRELASNFVFEKSDFKTAVIAHDFIIDEIITPKNEEDFAKMREMAKRKGKIIRRATIDEKEMVSEKEFEA